MGNSYLLSRLDHRLAIRQFKKDNQFAPPVDFSVKELSASERVAIINKRYIEESFSESDYEKKIRGEIIGVDDL